MKKIPKRNYIIVGVISILTFLIVGYLAFWYNETKEYNANNSIMTGYLSEIGEDEVAANLSNYILDNPNIVLYASYGDDSSVKDFENEFRKFINQNNIKQSFIYIDLSRIDDKNFINDFKDNFFSGELKNKNFNVEKQPNLYIFKEGKIESVLYYTKQSINMTDVKIFLEKQEVIEDD